MCGACQGTPSAHEMTTGRAFNRQIGSTKRGDRYADCRIRTGFALDRHFCYATGNRKWSSGESRFKLIWINDPGRDLPQLGAWRLINWEMLD